MINLLTLRMPLQFGLAKKHFFSDGSISTWKGPPCTWISLREGRANLYQETCLFVPGGGSIFTWSGSTFTFGGVSVCTKGGLIVPVGGFTCACRWLYLYMELGLPGFTCTGRRSIFTWRGGGWGEEWYGLSEPGEDPSLP
jgi:hypothetical protein